MRRIRQANHLSDKPRLRRVVSYGMGMLVVVASVLVTRPAAAHETVTTPTTAAIQPTATPTSLVARHSGKCLDVFRGGTGDFANIIQYHCVPTSPAQRWSLNLVEIVQGVAFYQLVAQHSGKCLGVANASTADVADIIQISCDSRKPEQQWAFTHVGSSQYLAVARHSSKCLDVFEGDTDDLTEIIQFRCVPLSQAQQWSFV
jgi:hypothetical protein